jgi:hypothetical protein
MVAKDIAARWEWPLRRFAWLEVAWGAFALANVVAMWLAPTWETVPFHFIWPPCRLQPGAPSMARWLTPSGTPRRRATGLTRRGCSPTIRSA